MAIDPVPILFGIKVKTIIWMIVAVVLGLIFSMTMWPEKWRTYYQKRKEAEKLRLAKEKKTGKKVRRKVNVFLMIAMLLILLLGIILGSMLGFRSAIDNLPQSVLAQNCVVCDDCQNIDCADIISTDCPGCVCSYCNYLGDGAVRIDIPMPSRQ